MATTPPAVEIRGLRRSFGDVEVLRGVDLTVRRGSVAALLGPNGAGKTTAVRILTTLLRPHGGTALVDGVDVVRDPAEVRRRIGLVGQHAAVDEVLSGRENLVMFGRLHHLTPRGARVRADELLERFELADAADRPVQTWSGGMRRRLDLAAGLLLEPAVLFLDEPTTGLDPAGRLTVWDDVRSLVAGGTTVLLTTQYLQEVDELADTVHVLDGGTVVAQGTPDELRASVGGDRLDVVVAQGDLDRARTLLVDALDVTADDVAVDTETRTLTAPVTGRTTALVTAVTTLAAAGVAVADVGVRRPSLDEVYLALTGHEGPRVPAAARTGGPTSPTDSPTDAEVAP